MAPKIKEKQSISAKAKEKIQAAPKELLRRGLLDGSEKLRGQLRDAVQQGQQDEFGGDCIENTASGGTKRGAEALLEKARHGKGRSAVTQPEISVHTPGAEAPKETPIAGESARIKTKGMAQGTQPTGSPSGSTGTAPSQIKTKDIYTRREAPGAETLRQQPSANGGAAIHRDSSPPGQPPLRPLEQGRQRLVRDQKKKAAAAQAEGRRRGADSKICPKPDESISTPVQRRFTSRPQIHHVPSQAVRGSEAPVDEAVKKTVSGARPRTKEARSEVKTGRTTRRTIKTVGRAAQKTVKTAGHGAKAAKKGIETAVQAHGRAAQAAGQTTAASAKRTGKAILSSLRRAAAAARNLTAALAAGGGVVLAVILVLCMAGLVVASPFGIFFSGGDSGSEQTMPEVIREINQEYDNKLENLKTAVVCDALNLSCSRASWPEVLAVYAVKTATDPDNEQEVVTMDDSKKALLKEIFWDMNELSSFTSTVPGEGGGEDITTLHITVTAKTAEEMADEFDFDDDQRQQLAELLSDEYRELWNSILYGIGAGDAEIVAVALSQVGNVGGQPYWSWYGFSYRVDWCAIFVSWCANECGYIDAGVVPKFAGCVQGSRWFKDRGQWQDRSYTPNPGDLIFFDWDNPGGFSGLQDGVPDHVGIVERVENGRVYTIEGNSGDKCCQRSYPVEYYEIYGYGCLYA